MKFYRQFQLPLILVGATATFIFLFIKTVAIPYEGGEMINGGVYAASFPFAVAIPVSGYFSGKAFIELLKIWKPALEFISEGIRVRQYGAAQPILINNEILRTKAHWERVQVKGGFNDVVIIHVGEKPISIRVNDLNASAELVLGQLLGRISPETDNAEVDSEDVASEFSGNSSDGFATYVAPKSQRGFSAWKILAFFLIIAVLPYLMKVLPHH